MADATTRQFDSAVIRRHAEGFGKDRFQLQFTDLVAARYAQRSDNSAVRENKQ
jgi:hypothetical protein